jgi:CBS domain-containing protein
MEEAMRVSEVMQHDVHIVDPRNSLAEVARIMADFDVGFLPVGDESRLIGTITDRDIVVRALAKGKGGSATVREAMTAEVKYCFEDDDLDQAVLMVSDQKIRRLPVLNRDRRLVGVVSIGDIARYHDPEAAGVALSGIDEPGGPHSQMTGSREALSAINRSA